MTVTEPRLLSLGEPPRGHVCTRCITILTRCVRHCGTTKEKQLLVSSWPNWLMRDLTEEMFRLSLGLWIQDCQVKSRERKHVPQKLNKGFGRGLCKMFECSARKICKHPLLTDPSREPVTPSAPEGRNCIPALLMLSASKMTPYPTLRLSCQMVPRECELIEQRYLG